MQPRSFSGNLYLFQRNLLSNMLVIPPQPLLPRPLVLWRKPIQYQEFPVLYFTFTGPLLSGCPDRQLPIVTSSLPNESRISYTWRVWGTSSFQLLFYWWQYLFSTYKIPYCWEEITPDIANPEIGAFSRNPFEMSWRSGFFWKSASQKSWNAFWELLTFICLNSFPDYQRATH